MTGQSPGWKTTEFYLQIAAQIAAVWGAVSGFIPPKYAAILSAIGIGVYTIARTVIKVIGDIQATKAVQTTVTTTNPAPVTTVTTPT